MSEWNEKDLEQNESGATEASPVEEINTDATAANEAGEASENTSARENTYNSYYTVPQGNPYIRNESASAGGAYEAPRYDQNPAAAAPFAEEKALKKGTVALVLGLISLIFSVVCCIACCLPISIVLSIISIIMAIQAKKLSPEKKMKGKALAGFICALVGIIISILSMLLFGFAVVYYLEHVESAEQEFERYMSDMMY